MNENNNKNQGHSFRDGVLTGRKTFQKYYTPKELKEFVEQHLHEDTIAVAPGVFFVFKDKVMQQRYLLGRSRSLSSTRRVNLKLAPKRTSEERDKEKYEEIVTFIKNSEADLIVFAENNLPYIVSDINQVELDKLLKPNQTLIIGATRNENNKYFNSLLVVEKNNTFLFEII